MREAVNGSKRSRWSVVNKWVGEKLSASRQNMKREEQGERRSIGAWRETVAIKTK